MVPESSSPCQSFDSMTSEEFRSNSARENVSVDSNDSSKTKRVRRKSNSNGIKKKSEVRVDLRYCKYDVVKKEALSRGWIVINEDNDNDDDDTGDDQSTGVPRDLSTEYNLIWMDMGLSGDKGSRIKWFQKINHFPGMYHFARKADMGVHLGTMAKEFPKEYDFFPRTFVLPQQAIELREYMEAGNNKKTFIIKPSATCQGRGIFLTRNFESINTSESSVAQRYIRKPLLIDGYKFDMRIYVVVTNVNPLRAFVFKDGLIRLCTEKYVEPNASNMSNVCAHLTNYSLNKSNDKFVKNAGDDDEGSGSKRSLKWFYGMIASEHGQEASTKLREGINDIFCKSLLSVNPILTHYYKNNVEHIGSSSGNGGENNLHSSCFEILGFDILVDSELRPWLIETNHHPSFSCDSPLDLRVKSELIKATMDLINVSGLDKTSYQKRLKAHTSGRLYKTGEANESEMRLEAMEQKETNRILKREEKLIADGSFTRIFPSSDPQLASEYAKYLAHATLKFRNLPPTRPTSVDKLDGEKKTSSKQPPRAPSAPPRMQGDAGEAQKTVRKVTSVSRVMQHLSLRKRPQVIPRTVETLPILQRPVKITTHTLTI